MKIRGNAAHIAEKYNSLARDAQTSGDAVMAENYYQHAEHYLRIIAASQQNNNQSNQQANAQNEQNRSNEENAKQEPAKKEEVAAVEENNEGVKGEGPQPELPIVPAEVKLKNENSLILEGNAEVNEAAEDEAAAKPKRNGRKPGNGRRTSRVDAKKPDSAAKPRKRASGELSEDAALLPSSLIGTGKDKDSDGTPVSADE